MPDLAELFIKLCHQTLHLVRERLAVVLGGFGADVAAGREHVSVLADIVEGGGFAEAGDVYVGATLVVAPVRGRQKASPYCIRRGTPCRVNSTCGL